MGVRLMNLAAGDSVVALARNAESDSAADSVDADADVDSADADSADADSGEADPGDVTETPANGESIPGEDDV
jgi:uncharacterized protein YbjT (DUF2867 family)